MVGTSGLDLQPDPGEHLRSRSADGGDRPASHRLGLACTASVPTYSIPSGLVGSRKPNRRAGEFDDALAALDHAAETAAATGEGYYQAELYRLRGVVLAETGEAAEAASWFQRAIETAAGPAGEIAGAPRRDLAGPPVAR